MPRGSSLVPVSTHPVHLVLGVAWHPCCAFGTRFRQAPTQCTWYLVSPASIRCTWYAVSPGTHAVYLVLGTTGRPRGALGTRYRRAPTRCTWYSVPPGTHAVPSCRMPPRLVSVSTCYQLAPAWGQCARAWCYQTLVPPRALTTGTCPVPWRKRYRSLPLLWALIPCHLVLV